VSKIAVIDYGMGNLRSVEKALEHVGADPFRCPEPDALAAADGAVLPGVGAFPEAMVRIRRGGFDLAIDELLAGSRPLLGVCLGMQLLFESSSENDGGRGLGVLAGSVERLAAPGLKLPHIGWCPVDELRPSPLTDGIAAHEPFYFVHAFAARALPGETIAEAEYGQRFPAIVARENVYGTQFHPEKSSAAGLRMLANFDSICAPVVAGG
jgi:imidazole glycerol-phosphate synthase subunit HisH